MSPATLTRTRPPSAPATALTQAWHAAASGDADARAAWSCSEGTGWRWEDGGVAVGGESGEWHAFATDALTSELRRALGRFRVEVTVSGRGRAAGISFGPFRDLLARLDPAGAPRRIAFDADLGSGCWSFSVDGALQAREWWDADLSPGVLADGRLQLKAWQPQAVRFSDLTLHTPPAAACRLSVILTCHRFSQRLRVTLRNWCAQTLPMGAYEVLVVNPGSPDATHAVKGERHTNAAGTHTPRHPARAARAL